MSEMIYIKDDFGTQIPLLDVNGNLSLQVIMLYSEDKLSEVDRQVVLDYAATDEMSQDALEGFALTGDPSKTRYTLGQLNSSIQKRSGAKAISILAPQREEFDYRKLAAAVALLVIVGGGTFFVSQYLGKDELADATPTKAKEESVSMIDPVVTDSFNLEEVPTEVVSEAEMLNDARDEVANDVTSPVVKAESEKTDAEPKLVESDKKTDHNTEKAKTGSGETGNENKKTLTVPSVAASDVVAGNLDIAADSDGLTTLLTKEKQKQDAQKDLAKGETIASNGKELEVAQSEANRKSKRNEEAERKRLTEEPQRAASISRIPAQETAYELAEEAVVDRTNAQFPGGDDKLRSFIARKKNYTNVMREQNLSGVIAVTFDVEADGRVSNARIKSGENGQFKADALRVVRSMPKWKPATVNDEPIKSMVTLELIYGEE